MCVNTASGRVLEAWLASRNQGAIRARAAEAEGTRSKMSDPLQAWKTATEAWHKQICSCDNLAAHFQCHTSEGGGDGARGEKEGSEATEDSIDLLLRAAAEVEGTGGTGDAPTRSEPSGGRLRYALAILRAFILSLLLLALVTIYLMHLSGQISKNQTVVAATPESLSLCNCCGTGIRNNGTLGLK